MRRSRRAVLFALAVVLPLAVVIPAGATPYARGGPTPPPWLRLENGVSVPQFDLANAVEETLFVQTTVDSDLDGVRDRVRVRLSRPGETVSQGIKVPVIFEHSPYRYNTGGGENHNVDYSVLPQEGLQPSAARTDATPIGARPEPDLPGSLDNYWVPRGYAVVLGESIGTGFSDGCPTVGDMKETLGTKAVIDWLNGRAKAYNEAGEPVTADWTTGDVGMVGTSYNGTLPNQVATTGVEGLRTIVPTSAIASWYDYYRANGLVRAPHSNVSGLGENSFQGEDLDVLAYYVEGPDRVEKCRHITDALLQYADRTTGDYNAYWDERDYLHRARGIKASVFVVHGLEDYNVMPTAYASWWAQLERYNVPRKLWLHKGGHGGPTGTSDYQVTLNRWMDYWLFGVRNGIMAEPRADIQRPDGTYEKYADWPVPGARDATLKLSSPNATDPGGLARSGGGPRQSFVDSGRTLDTDVSLVPNPATANPNRLAYLSAPLSKSTHLSGTPSVSLRASVDNRYSANLTGLLVDYAQDGSATVVTRGWTDVQNRKGADRSSPVVQGREYTFDWPLEPDDYVFPAGHRIGLVVVSTDMNFTLRPSPGTQLTVNPGKSSVTLPVVGGL
ncbi:Xaa-Pro dipeptidyl-peptidase [Actinophytocola oryzae]|uniref:Xaa-Pro dipeptidyl-peptidase n=1 Tax=Actinophytocola oryzae TaxID=502181 RepID=A0A4R7VRI0_9PSEU|nr:Xaa-Pro dipeptidyl-peptidase [Actinophytocola oryzae]TDV52410.1 X-Pro dipeptidyl-peptidase [Actinophytocola oryzae]